MVADCVVFLEEISRVDSEVNPIDAVAAVSRLQGVVVDACCCQLLPVPRKSIIVADSVIFLEEIGAGNFKVKLVNTVASSFRIIHCKVCARTVQSLPVPHKRIIVADSVVFLEEIRILDI